MTSARNLDSIKNLDAPMPDVGLLDEPSAFSYNNGKLDNESYTGIDMLYEVEVLADGNSPMDLNRVFDLLDAPKPVGKIFTSDLVGEDRWCDVTGWSDQGQCPAYAVKAEDSGDGVILLIYGGNEGIRLKPDDSEDDWELENASQWGEPCLMLGANTQYVEPS